MWTKVPVTFEARKRALEVRRTGNNVCRCDMKESEKTEGRGRTRVRPEYLSGGTERKNRAAEWLAPGIDGT